MKRGEREGGEGGRLTVREREEDRSAARTLRYQREGAAGGGDAGTNILYALYRPYQTASSDVTRATRCLLLSRGPAFPFPFLFVPLFALDPAVIYERHWKVCLRPEAHPLLNSVIV